MAGHRCRCGLGLEPRAAPSRLLVLRARLGSLVLLSALVAGPVQAATFTVNSTGDGDAVAPINDGICDADATAAVVCTLRAALTEANNFGGPDTIAFAIVPGGLQTITPGLALPTIATQVTIDGHTQGGGGYTGPPLIQIDGTSAGAVHGFTLTGAGSSSSTIRGLVINGFGGAACYGIRILSGSINNLVVGNYVGTDPTGLLARPNRTGMILQTSGNRVGGILPGEPNLISGNLEDGIQITDGRRRRQPRRGQHHRRERAGHVRGAQPRPGGRDPRRRRRQRHRRHGGGDRNVISGNGNDGILIANAGRQETSCRETASARTPPARPRSPTSAASRSPPRRAATPSAAQRAPAT